MRIPLVILLLAFTILYMQQQKNDFKTATILCIGHSWGSRYYFKEKHDA
jgi:hypothetical protein